jgi:hypothetical protein
MTLSCTPALASGRRRSAEARDPAFQDQLMDRLAALTGVALF